MLAALHLTHVSWSVGQSFKLALKLASLLLSLHLQNKLLCSDKKFFSSSDIALVFIIAPSGFSQSSATPSWYSASTW